MAENKKQISEYFSGLPENSSPSSATYLVVEENGVTKKIPINLFIHKDDSGNVDVSGLISVTDGATFGGAVDIKYGEYLRLHSEDNTKYTDIYCDDDGNLIGKGDSPIATEKYVDETVASIPSGGSGSSRYSEGLAFTLNADNNSYSVSGIGTCTDTDIIIPPTYEGKPVTSIGKDAFEKHPSIVSVVIPDSVISIDMDAFDRCPSIVRVVIGNSVTSIGLNAFDGCSALTDVVMGYSVTSIGSSAFNNCSSLRRIVIPDSVTSMGAFVFSGCGSLTIYCEASSKPSGWDNGWNMSNRPVVWGAVTNVLDVNNKLAEMGTGDSSIIDLGDIETHKDAQQAMVDYVSELTDEQGGVLFKYFCTCYGNACFAVVDYYRGSEGHYSCYGTVYDSMRSFREFVYSSDEGFSLDGCWHSIASFDEVFDELQTENKSVLGAIKEIHAIATNGYKPSSFYFTSLDDENTWIVGRDYDENRQEALIPSTWCGSPVTSIGDEAFYNCISLINVSIPNSITSIGNFAFRNCYSLTSVVIPDSVTSIGYYAFFDCPNLTIYCEAQSKPDGWDYRWNPDNCPVVWGYATDIMGVNKKLAEMGDGGSSGGATLSMPRIRLSNWKYTEPATLYIDDGGQCHYSGEITFSVCVQDGTVQEGDQLQICALRRTYGKYKLRVFAGRTITAEDIENLAKQPYLQFTVNNMKHIHHTDSANPIKAKPKYIRIRRPIWAINKHGDEVVVNALFSNEVPVHIGLKYVDVTE